MAEIQQLSAAEQALADATRETEQTEGVPSDLELYGHMMTPKPEPTPATLEQAEPEGTVEEAPQEPVELVTEATPEDRVYAGQYRSVDALEQGALEKERFIEQLKAENARFREMEQQIQTLQQQAQQPAYDAGAFQDIVEQNPVHAVQLALQRNDQYGLDTAMRAWHEIDPYEAGKFQGQLLSAQLQQQMQQAQQAQMAPVVQQSQELSNRQAYDAVSSKHTDFNEVLATITPEEVERLRQANPVLARVMQETANGTAADKEAVFETLYALGKAKLDVTVRQAVQEAAQEAAQESRAAKQAATVASASTTTTTEVPMTEDDRLTQVFQQYAAGRNMRAGWKGQETRH